MNVNVAVTFINVYNNVLVGVPGSGKSTLLLCTFSSKYYDTVIHIINYHINNYVYSRFDVSAINEKRFQKLDSLKPSQIRGGINKF